MWTRTYLCLLLIRIYFAVSPSYIHPDENFQGPEVAAGWIFELPHHKTWEFTSDAPVRSIFPIWPVYALPMLVLKWIWAGVGTGDVPPEVTYYVLRLLMFILSFVLEDWAIHELVQSPRYRRLAATLVASSYVTWTYQTHTFSNSIETLAVLWSLVMMQRILDSKNSPSLLSSAILGLIITFGTFNRITFPSFTALPLLLLGSQFLARPSALLTFMCSAGVTTLLAIATDTKFYNPHFTLLDIIRSPVITPLNSILYNTDRDNLANHGLHPQYQHLLVNLPQLLGPALVLLPSTIRSSLNSLPIISFLSSFFFLSLIPHQEARFLVPHPPLLLSCIHLPNSWKSTRRWLAAWVAFNTIFAVLMGIYHQGGVIPGQIWLGQQAANRKDALSPPLHEIFWWRTYPPPIYLTGSATAVNTTDLMGMPFPAVQQKVQHALGDCGVTGTHTVGLAAPWSSTEVESWQASAAESGVQLTELWRWHKHLNLDDMDFAGDGVWATVMRVIGRRGLVIWRVERRCEGHAGRVLGGDW